MEHSLDGGIGPLANLFVDHDFKLFFLQRLERVFQRDLIHVWTPDATEPQHFFIRISSSDIVTHRTLGQH